MNKINRIITFIVNQVCTKIAFSFILFLILPTLVLPQIENKVDQNVEKPLAPCYTRFYAVVGGGIGKAIYYFDNRGDFFNLKKEYVYGNSKTAIIFLERSQEDRTMKSPKNYMIGGGGIELDYRNFLSETSDTLSVSKITNNDVHLDSVKHAINLSFYSICYIWSGRINLHNMTLFLEFQPKIGLMFNNRYSHVIQASSKEYKILPKNGFNKYVDDQSIIKEEIIDGRFLFGLSLQVSYDIVVDRFLYDYNCRENYKVRTPLIISPKVNCEFGITTMREDSNERSHRLGVGIDFRIPLSFF